MCSAPSDLNYLVLLQRHPGRVFAEPQHDGMFDYQPAGSQLGFVVWSFRIQCRNECMSRFWDFDTA